MGLFQNLFHRSAVFPCKNHAWCQWWWRFPPGHATWHWCRHSRQRLHFFPCGVGVAIHADDLAMVVASVKVARCLALGLQLGLQVAGMQQG